MADLPASAMRSSKMIKAAALEGVSGGFDHWMCSTRKDQINADLLAFIKA